MLEEILSLSHHLGVHQPSFQYFGLASLRFGESFYWDAHNPNLVDNRQALLSDADDQSTD